MEKKENRVIVRMTKEEKNLIEKRAEMCGLSVSAYMRQCALNTSSITVRTNKNKVLQELAPMSTEIEFISDKELRESIRRRALLIWQYLNM